MSRSIALVTACALLAACATTPQATYQHHAASGPLPCASQAACDLAWGNLQVWISQHSRWRIRMANDVLIETFGPSTIGYGGGDLAFSATRMRNADGSGSITISTACAWISASNSCNEDPAGAISVAAAAVQTR